jgi:hypothetical protein
MQVVEIKRGHGAAFMRAGLVLTACGHCHDFRLKTGSAYKVRPLTDQGNSGTDVLKAWQALVVLNELARSFRVTSPAAQVRPHAIASAGKLPR